MPYITESCGTKRSQNKGPWESKAPGKQRPQEIKSHRKSKYTLKVKAPGNKKCRDQKLFKKQREEK